MATSERLLTIRQAAKQLGVSLTLSVFGMTQESSRLSGRLVVIGVTVSRTSKLCKVSSLRVTFSEPWSTAV